MSFEEYTEMGYDSIPEQRFYRYICKAGSIIETNTLGRVTDEFLNSEDSDQQLVKKNKRGICEVADLVYDFDNVATGESGAKIKSFSNEGYSETFVDKSTTDAKQSFSQNLKDILSTFFTTEQLSRQAGV